MGWHWLPSTGKKGEAALLRPLRLPKGRAGHRLVQPGRVGRHFTILTDSATLFLPLMSYEILTFSPTFRPGSLKVSGSVKDDPLSSTRLMAVASKVLMVPVVCLTAANATEPEASKAAAAADTMILRMGKYSWKSGHPLAKGSRIVLGRPVASSRGSPCF